MALPAAPRRSPLPTLESVKTFIKTCSESALCSVKNAVCARDQNDVMDKYCKRIRSRIADHGFSIEFADYGVKGTRTIALNLNVVVQTGDPDADAGTVCGLDDEQPGWFTEIGADILCEKARFDPSSVSPSDVKGQTEPGEWKADGQDSPFVYGKAGTGCTLYFAAPTAAPAAALTPGEYSILCDWRDTSRKMTVLDDGRLLFQDAHPSTWVAEDNPVEQAECDSFFVLPPVAAGGEVAAGKVAAGKVADKTALLLSAAAGKGAPSLS